MNFPKFLPLLSLAAISFAGVVFLGDLDIFSFQAISSPSNQLPSSSTHQFTIIPSAILPCLPKIKALGELSFQDISIETNVKALTLVAQAKYQSKHYYLVNISEEAKSIFADDPQKDIVDRPTVVELDELGCQVIVPRERGLTDSLTLYLPEALAQQLALASLQHRIAAVGGREKFLTALTADDFPSDAADGSWIYFPEEVWAYQQLNLPLQKPSVIVKSWDELEEKHP